MKVLYIVNVSFICFFFSYFLPGHVETKREFAHSVGTKCPGGVKSDEKWLLIRAPLRRCQLTQPILVLPSDFHTPGTKQRLKVSAASSHQQG